MDGAAATESFTASPPAQVWLGVMRLLCQPCFSVLLWYVCCMFWGRESPGLTASARLYLGYHASRLHDAAVLKRFRAVRKAIDTLWTHRPHSIPAICGCACAAPRLPSKADARHRRHGRRQLPGRCWPIWLRPRTRCRAGRRGRAVAHLDQRNGPQQAGLPPKLLTSRTVTVCKSTGVDQPSSLVQEDPARR